ncbi:hypothetical protein BSLG_006535 [Batrachochytrium salamandrivorans]|nr:hypothetical protein BSLG_006535 [Batrachochytrium salamandrivorans]
MTAKGWLFSDRALLASPSVSGGGWTPGTEAHTRLRACRFIERCARRLALPHDMQATAKIFLHRFYMRASLKDSEYHDVASALLFLCGKLGDGRNYKHIEQIVNVCANDAAKSRSFAQIPENSTTFSRWKNTIMSHEEYALQLLCFDLSPDLPHPHALELIKKNKGSMTLQKLAFAYCDEALCTTLAVRCSAVHIAHAAAHAARLTLRGNDPLDNGAEWYHDAGLDLMKLKALEISLAADEVQLSRLALVRESKIKDLLKMRQVRRSSRAASRRARVVGTTSNSSPRSSAVPGTPSTGITDTSPQWSPSKRTPSISPPFAPVPDQSRPSGRTAVVSVGNPTSGSSVSHGYNASGIRVANSANVQSIDSMQSTSIGNAFNSQCNHTTLQKEASYQTGHIYRQPGSYNTTYQQTSINSYNTKFDSSFKLPHNQSYSVNLDDASLHSTIAGAIRTNVSGDHSYNPYTRPKH